MGVEARERNTEPQGIRAMCISAFDFYFISFVGCHSPDEKTQRQIIMVKQLNGTTEIKGIVRHCFPIFCSSAFAVA